MSSSDTPHSKRGPLFCPGGIQGVHTSTWLDHRFEAWKMGRTGQPFIDANMNELRTTGFMSNRGRQNVASYLVHDLKQTGAQGPVGLNTVSSTTTPVATMATGIMWPESAMIPSLGGASTPSGRVNDTMQKGPIRTLAVGLSLNTTGLFGHRNRDRRPQTVMYNEGMR